MRSISYAGHRFPPDVIRHAVWLYLRFALSYRDVEELLVERGWDVSHETIRRWVLKFGLQFARNLSASRPRPSGQCHLDETVVSVGGIRHWLWRAVDMRWENFPASLKQDVDAWLDRLAGRDFADVGPSRPVRPSTLATREYQLRSFASALFHQGHDPQELRTLADLVVLETFNAGLLRPTVHEGGEDRPVCGQVCPQVRDQCRRPRHLPFFAYATNYLIDLQHAVIIDVEASRAIRQAEVGAARTMIERKQDRFNLWPARLAADSAYGSADNLAWLVHERGIEPHIPVFDKSERQDGTFSRSEFTYDHDQDAYVCPAGKLLRQRQRNYRYPQPLADEDGTMRYRASKHDCDACAMKPRCCPNTPGRKIPRSIHVGARDMARAIADTEEYVTSRRQRKKVEMLFAHLKRILRLDRLRLRGPQGAQDEFHLAAAAQNLRKLAKLLTNAPQRMAA